MAYEKQNFKNGEILPADKLNHIEDGIVDLENSRAKIDDLNITTDKAWSSRRIIDTLCPPIDETGNPVVCYPVAGYPLGCKVSWEPTQEGSGEPSPDNVRPIKGRDSVTVERCGENLLNIAPFTKQTTQGVTYEYVTNGGIHISGTALANAVGPMFSVWYLPPGKYYGLDSGKGIGSSIVVRRNGENVWLGTKGTFVILAGDEIRFWCFSVNSGTTVDETLFPYIAPGTTAPTTYAPYTGQTSPLTLPHTIYGGTVDAVTGDGQETWDLKELKIADMNNLDAFPGWKNQDWLEPYKGTAASGILNRTICDCTSKNKAKYNGNTLYFEKNAFNGLTQSELIEKYHDLILHIALLRNSPTPFTASGGVALPALGGVNTVLTDADSVTVTGRAMPEKNRNQNLFTDILFKYPRTGKVYTVKIPKFTSNPTTVCEKLDDNTGLVCEASTDTIEGRDDYAEIPLFKWYNCNYKRDENGHAYPIAIEGFDDNYTTSGNIDVGVIQMTPFVKWDDSNDDYIILSITDNPTEGYRAWSTARVGGEVCPYVIHSKYISSLGTDGLLHSVPNAKPERNQSYNNMITNYAKKGSGYKGAGVERNTWQVIFTLIKYANKSSQNIFAGTTGYSFQYSASIQSAEKHTYFPVTNAQAANIIIGGYVSVGYAYKTSDTATSLDRSYDTVHSYADSVKVLKIEDLDDSNKAVYLDVKEGFDTIQHEYSDTLSAPITLTSIHWYSGSTDSVMGHHDGSFVNNNNSEYPYRVQGVEYAVGGYTVASDTVIVFTDNNEKDVYVSPSNIAHSSADATIKSNYKNVGHIPSGEWWIGDIGFDTDTNATWPTVRGSGNATGVGDYNYGSTGNNGTIREYLQGGHLGHGLRAGSSFLYCGDWLGSAGWNSLSAD